MRRPVFMLVLTLAFALLSQNVAVAAPGKRLEPDGSVPARWNLPKPVVEPHPDEPPINAGLPGDGHNAISFSSFDDGDIIVGLGDSITGHAGEWDDYFYHGSVYDTAVWSALKTANRVLRQTAIGFRSYDRAYGLWVPSVPSTTRVSTRNYCRAQVGEPYDIASSKSNTAEWYCSKLPWAAYKYRAGVDLDANGGYYVWPADLLNDPSTYVFASSN